jgi:hypothetical protein
MSDFEYRREEVQLLISTIRPLNNSNQLNNYVLSYIKYKLLQQHFWRHILGASAKAICNISINHFR